MLSPHEIATLLLIESAANARNIDPADLEALVHQELVRLEDRAPGQLLPRLTSQGQNLLQAFAGRR